MPPRKVIKANEKKNKRGKVVKPLILICIILLIAAIVATVIYVIDFNTEEDLQSLLGLNETTVSSNDTTNETKASTPPDNQEITVQFEEETIQLEIHKTIENNLPNDTTTESSGVIVSALPTPEVNFTFNGNLKTLLSETPANFSTALVNMVDYLKFLGMKWCSLGMIAPTDVDLRPFQKADACVREHELCSEVIGFGQTKHELKNLDMCKRSHCDCDRNFYRCLKYKHDLMANTVGFEYFTILGPKCFMENYPIVQCHKCEYSALSFKKRNRKRCIDYEFNMTEPKKYQWFDIPLYY